MRALVCGGRNWSDKELIRQVIGNTPNIELIIEGGAIGADRLAAEVASEMGIPIRECPADWKAYGRAAGPIRNKEMLGEKPDIIIAFHDSIGDSKGTKNMIEQARKGGIPVLLMTHKGRGIIE